MGIQLLVCLNTQGIPVVVLKDNCRKSAGLVLLSTENRIKIIYGTLFYDSSTIVKRKEPTNGYLGI